MVSLSKFRLSVRSSVRSGTVFGALKGSGEPPFCEPASEPIKTDVDGEKPLRKGKIYGRSRQEDDVANWTLQTTADRGAPPETAQSRKRAVQQSGPSIPPVTAGPCKYE